MGIGSISAATAKQWREKGEMVLVDVREPSEWNVNRIEGATLIPLATVKASLLPAHEGKKLVIHCRSGKRSLTACEMLTRENPALEVYNMEGGILAWEALGQK